jgi:hypothetical protein
MHGLIVMHHLVHDVAAQTLRNGLAALGVAVAPKPALSTPERKQADD